MLFHSSDKVAAFWGHILGIAVKADDFFQKVGGLNKKTSITADFLLSIVKINVCLLLGWNSIFPQGN